MIETFAQGILADMLSRTPADQLAKITPEMREGRLDMLRKVGAELVESFKTREGTWTEYQKGRLEFSNPHSRRLFEEVTGISLGKNGIQCKETVTAYVGKEVIEARHARIKAEREAFEEGRRRKAEEERNRIISAIKAKVIADLPIAGDDLVDIAREFKIDLHPRSVGTARKRVRSINSGSAVISGKGCPDSLYATYRQVRSILTQAAAQPEIVAG